VKNKNGEYWYQRYLADKSLCEMLEKFDNEMAEKCRGRGCLYCSGTLHRADYERKPRGGPGDKDPDPPKVYRDSFCCDREGCRKRHTPPSLRFLGRKVYRGIVVVLVSALRNGFSARQVQKLRESLGIDRRTLERWRSWWLKVFVKTPFWKAARARFMPSICEASLPLSLCEDFKIDRRDRLLDLLKFISPLTGSSIYMKHDS
jgi:hypothetical protein